MACHLGFDVPSAFNIMAASQPMPINSERLPAVALLVALWRPLCSNLTAACRTLHV